jgi:hypothetical protein
LNGVYEVKNGKHGWHASPEDIEAQCEPTAEELELLRMWGEADDELRGIRHGTQQQPEQQRCDEQRDDADGPGIANNGCALTGSLSAARELPCAEPDQLEPDLNDQRNQLENFANLASLEGALRGIEADHILAEDINPGAIGNAREALVFAIKQACQSRFNLGRALFEYRAEFKASRGWTDAACAIASALHVNEKTVRNIIDDYEQLSASLPAVVIEVADSRGIDLARKKHRSAVKAIEAMIDPDEAVDEVTAAHLVDNVIPFRTNSKTQAPKADLNDFVNRTVRSFEKRYNRMAPEVRDAEVRYVFETITATLHVPITELRQYGRSALVPKPVTQEVGAE